MYLKEKKFKDLSWFSEGFKAYININCCSNYVLSIVYD